MAGLMNLRTLSLGLVAVGLMFTSPAYAGSLKHGEKIGSWEAICPTLPDGKIAQCRLVQIKHGKTKDGKAVSAINASIAPMPNGKKVFFVSLPLGYTIPQGVKLSVDGDKATMMTPQRCMPQGCELAHIIDKKLLARLKKGKAASIKFHLGRNIGTLTVPLDGLSKALAKL